MIDPKIIEEMEKRKAIDPLTEEKEAEFKKYTGIDMYLMDDIFEAIETSKFVIRELPKPNSKLKKDDIELYKSMNYTDKEIKHLIDENLNEHKEFLKSALEVLEKWGKLKNNTSKTTKKINSKLEALESIIPSKHIIPNNKLSNEITKELIGIGEVALTVANKDKNNEVSTIVSINYNDEGIKLYNKANFTPYDRTVHNAVCSLYEAGNKNITPAMVYRAMNGQTGTEKISPQSIGAVTKSLDKSRTMSCKIDYTEEAKARNIPVTKTIIEDMILPAQKVTVKAGGKEISAYKLHSKPIMYEYAQVTKQIITVPIELLQTKSAIRSTEDVIVIREYLLRRIEIMKHSNKHSNKILYESIYKELGLNTEVRTQALADKTKKVRKAVKELLTFWKMEKYIKKFAEYKEGRTFKGIDIFY